MHSKREICCQKERISLREIVMPRISAVENGQGLSDVEVEKFEWWKGELLVVAPVKH